MIVGYCVGVFDMLHYGHKNLLLESQKYCDKLIIGVHTDEFVKNYKRLPTQNQELRRANIINYLGKDPSEVVIIADNHIDLVRKFGINVIFHGTDWEIESYKKQIRYYADGMDQLGVEIKLIEYSRGISTTDIINDNVTSLSTKKCILFDLDNTLILNNQPTKFASDVITQIEKLGKQWYVITNNNRYSPEELIEVLANCGINVPSGHFISTLTVIRDYLRNHPQFKRIAVWGTESAKKYLSEQGYTITFEKPDLVVILYNNSFNYDDLSQVATLVLNYPYIIGNIDPIYPDKHKILPDTGCMHKYLEYCSQKPPVEIFGKPYNCMIESILNQYAKKDVVFIGDSEITDAKLCNNSQIDFIRVHAAGDISHLGILCDYL